ncbi:MAG: hypothetical protein IKF38_06940 [Clostridia bacterium]|nr:hypothetical protein [Clostridia bacterium]
MEKSEKEENQYRILSENEFKEQLRRQIKDLNNILHEEENNKEQEENRDER